MSEIDVYEGFDLVGKTTLARGRRTEVPVYRPDYDVLDRNGYDRKAIAFMFGIAQSDLLRHMRGSGFHLPDMALDRGPVSSYVYSRIYPTDPEIPVDVVVRYLTNLSQAFDAVRIDHVSHSSRKSAQSIYEHFLADSGRVHEELDSFDGFDAYWNRYMLAEALFSYVYRQTLGSVRSRGNVSLVRWTSRATADGLEFEPDEGAV